MVFVIPKMYVRLIIIHFNPNISQTLFISNLSYNTCIYNMQNANSNMAKHRKENFYGGSLQELELL